MKTKTYAYATTLLLMFFSILTPTSAQKFDEVSSYLEVLCDRADLSGQEEVDCEAYKIGRTKGVQARVDWWTEKELSFGDEYYESEEVDIGLGVSDTCVDSLFQATTYASPQTLVPGLTVALANGSNVPGIYLYSRGVAGGRSADRPKKLFFVLQDETDPDTRYELDLWVGTGPDSEHFGAIRSLSLSLYVEGGDPMRLFSCREDWCERRRFTNLDMEDSSLRNLHVLERRALNATRLAVQQVCRQ